MKSYAFGVDLGGTTVKLGLFGPEGLADQWEIPTRTANHGEALLPDIAAACRPNWPKKALTLQMWKGWAWACPALCWATAL